MMQTTTATATTATTGTTTARAEPASPATHTNAPPTAPTNPGGPLTGVRILDITSVLMGPFATQILGDLGADVVKVEPPSGDMVRGIGPERHAGMGGIFLHANRSKRSLVLDLKQPEGREALLRLTAEADVLIYNVRPQAMARLGLGYEAVREVNPRILYVGVYGYGQGGPYAARPAYDDLIQGATALPTLAASAGSDVPRYVPLAMVDRIVGMSAANAVSAGLYHRERTGRGQSIEVPMFETMAQFVLSDHLAGRSFEPPIGPAGYARLLSQRRRPYATLDGHLCVLIYSDRQWNSFFHLIGRADELLADPRFATIGARTRHIGELYALVGEVMAKRSSAEWTALFEAADIAVMPLHTLDSLIDDPHLRAVGFFEEVEHPSEGRLRTMRVASTWSDSPPVIRRQAPRLGEHSAELLAEAGYGTDEIARMARAGVTRLAPAHPASSIVPNPL